MERSDVQEKLNQYENEKLIVLFQTRLGMKSREVALEKMKELKKLLYVIYLVQEKQVPVQRFDLTSKMHELDEMWHLFIIMTADYASFCNQIFGTFLHHEPEIPNLALNAAASIQNINLREQVQLVMDLWGPETMQAWYLGKRKSHGFKEHSHSKLSARGYFQFGLLLVRQLRGVLGVTRGGKI